MLRRIFSLILMMSVPVAVMAAELPDAPSESKRIENTQKNLDDMKKVANSLQVSGKTASVTLNDKAKLSGQITKVTENGFVLKTGEGLTRELAFIDVQGIKKPGMSRGAKIAIGVGVGIAASMGLACLATHCTER